MPDRMSEDMTDRMSEDIPDRMSEDMADRMSDRMSEDRPDGFARWNARRYASLKCQIDMPEGMPEKYARRFSR